LPTHRCSILSIGNELLLGLTVDTNAAWLCREVSNLGWTVERVRTEGDYTEAIVQALAELAGTASLVLVSGGLGPTEDDRTREALARACGQPLEERADLLQQIEARFRQINRPMRPVNRVQAQVPRGAEGIANTCGTAPGIACRIGNAAVYATPGVPHEMKEMFRLSILPRIRLAETAGAQAMRRLHLFGIGESNVGEAIREWMRERANPEVGTAVGDAVITVRALAHGETEAEARRLCDEFDQRLTALFGAHIFGRDEETLPEVVV
jgi:nicotinamide-nucleotide amidase